MKKLNSILAALLMAITLIAVLCSAVSAQYSTRLPFTDAEEGQWYAEYVSYVYDRNLMLGKGDGKFAPQKGMTRAEMATLLSRMAGADVTGLGRNAGDFTDVDVSKWYGDYIGWAVEAGVLTGYSDGTMRPNKTVSRQEIVTIISRFSDALGVVLPEDTAVPTFSDAADIKSYAVDSVNRLAAAGIIEGSNGKFNPAGELTRAQASKIIMMLHQIMTAEPEGATLSYDRDTAESYKVWGAKQLYYAGTGYCGNMTASLDESGELPLMVFEDIVGADRDAQTSISGNTATAPWYIGVNTLILKVDTAKYPVLALKLKLDTAAPETLKGTIDTDTKSVEFTADPVAADGYTMVYMNLTEINGGTALPQGDEKYIRVKLYPYGEATEAGNVALLYAGFFKNAADAGSFDESSIADYMNANVSKYTLDWREMTSDVADKYDEAVETRIDQILSAEGIDPATITGTCYYVSSVNGDDSNSGTSPDSPWKTFKNLHKWVAGGTLCIEITKSGDAIFLERGSVFYSEFASDDEEYYEIPDNEGLTISAYGEGDKPLITHALDIEGSMDWSATEYENVWVLDQKITDPDQYTGDLDVGNIVFNGGEGWGIKVLASDVANPYTSATVYSGFVTNGYEVYKSGGQILGNPGGLQNNLEYFHDWFTGDLYLYYDGGNPGEAFESIIISPRGYGLGAGTKDMLIDNLALKYIGAHAITSGKANNVTIQNCEIGWIGGSVQDVKELNSSTRFGNAIENWGECYEMTVKDCYIYQVYDGTLSTQSSGASASKNIEFCGNVLTYGNSPIEIWGSSRYENIHVHDNYMLYSGFHFGHQRNSKNGSFNCGLGDYCTDGWIMEDNVMLYSAIFAHLGWAFDNDHIDGGMVSRNNVYALSSTRSFFYRGFEDITVNYNIGKSNYIYYPYTERYMRYLTSLGAEQGTTFYWYEYDITQWEEDGAYR